MAVKEQIIFHISAQGAELTRGQMISLGKTVKNLGIPIDKVTSATQKGANAFGRMNVSMGNLLVNALKWAIAYKILYGAINIVLTGITDSIKAWKEFDDIMAKVKTTTRDSGDGIEKTMRVFSRAVKAVAMDSRQNIIDIADVLFYLGSAGLNAQEQLAGLKPTIDLATGTGENLEVTVRTLTGAYNTLKDTLGENVKAGEEFIHMADIIAYTFSKEEVLLNELAQGLKYVAGDAKSAGLNFDQVVAILGFLNTQMLKSGQAGRNLSQSFRQLITHAKDLAHELGIAIDPSKPLNFLEVISAISNRVNELGGRSAEVEAAIAKVFGGRSVRVIQRFLNNFDELKKDLDEVSTKSEGFAEKLAEIKMDTISAQTARLNNILKISAQNFLSATTGAGDFIDSLKKINEELKLLPDLATKYGVGIRAISQRKIPLIPGVFSIVNITEFLIRYKKALKEQEKLSEETLEKRAKEAEIQAKLEEEQTKLVIKTEKERKENVRHIIELMKILGSSAAQALQKELELTKDIVDENEREIEQLKITNKLMEERARFVESIADITREHVISLAEAAGLSELDIAKDRLKYALSLNNAEERQIEILKARNALELAHLNILKEERENINQNAEIFQKLLNLYKQPGQRETAKQLIEFQLGRRKYEDLGYFAKEEFSKYFPEVEQRRKLRQDVGGILGIDYDETIAKFRDLDSRRAEAQGRALGEALTKLPELKAVFKHQIEVVVKASLEKTEEVDKQITKKIATTLNSPEMLETIKKIAQAEAHIVFEVRK